MMIAVVGTAAAVYWLDWSILKDITGELITFFGIQAAVVLPAMLFTAGLLKAEGVSLEEARRYRRALRGQMTFWVTLLSLDVASVVLLIVGKAADWSMIINVPAWEWSVNPSSAMLGATTVVGLLALLRMVHVVQGIRSLLEANADLTENAIKARNAQTIQQYKEAADERPFKNPEGFGRVLPPN